MASISVKEKDLSWYYRQRQRGNLIVYMPGLSTFGPETPTYVYEDTFESIFGSAVNVKNDYSFYMAQSLLRSGIDVLFHRMVPTGAVAAEGILDGAEYAVTAEVATDKYRVTVDNTTNTDLTITINETQYVFTANTTTTLDFELTFKDAVDSALESAESQPDKYTVTKEVINNSITILGQQFPAGATYTNYYPTDKQAEVDTIIAEIEAGDTHNYYSFTETTTTGSDKVIAKYVGSYGNNLIVKSFRGNSQGLRYVYVYRGETLVEQFTVDFLDPMSKYYYESIKDEIKYVDFEYRDDVPTTVLGNAILKDGKDYGASIDPISDVISNKLINSDTFDVLKDPYGYYFDVVINGMLYSRDTDYTVDDNNVNYTVDKNLRDVAIDSGTAVYLMSAGLETKEGDFFNYCGDSEFTKTSYVAAVGPWCYSQLVSNGAYAWLPGYYPFLIAWGNSISAGNPSWYAPAGAQRARVGSVVKRPKYEIGKAVLDKWQNQNNVTLNVYRLNPIMNLKQYGYCVYGNSTLLANKPDGSTSMLQSLGTRVMVNKIKEQAFEVALGLQFDQLSDNLFMAFKVEMGTYMDRLKYSGALGDYEIVVDRTTVTYDDLNQRTVPVKIRISPNPAAENFVISCEVYPAGITFTDELDETGILI